MPSPLRSTKRDKIENLIAHMTKMGNFIAPGSLLHHRLEGGLVRNNTIDRIEEFGKYLC